MKEHNVEVALTKCFICGNDSDIVMNSILTKKHADSIKEMHGKVITKEPCSKCEKYMDEGIILISADESKTDDIDNPYRTGGFFVVKEEAVKGFMIEPMLSDVLKKRICFIEHQIAEDLGLFKFAEKSNEV